MASEIFEMPISTAPFADPAPSAWEEPEADSLWTSPHDEINERRARVENLEALRLARSL